MPHPIATFDHAVDFAAVDAAERACRDAGFSIGSMQRGSPRGLLLGSACIGKWRNLSSQERLVLHGLMEGGRTGPVTVTLHDCAPPPAVAAFYKLLARSEAMRGLEA